MQVQELHSFLQSIFFFFNYMMLVVQKGQLIQELLFFII